MYFRKSLVTLFLSLFFHFSHGQILKGKIFSSASSQPLASIKVVAKSLRDTSNKFIVFTDSLGNFSITTGRGMFGVWISKDGYISDYKLAKMFLGDTNFGIIILKDTASRLKEAIITGNAAPATQRGDTSEYNAAAYKTNPDATAEDLLKKLPGMTVQNGQVTAQGEQVKKVTVDGKDWFGDDASAVLRNLPAEVVDKMQVFDRGSDQSNFSRVDDGSSSKSINIVTKKGLLNGKFGKAYTGYGTNDRYQAGFNYNTFKGERRFSILGLTNNINQQNFTSQDLLGLSMGSGGGGRMGGTGTSGGSGMGSSGYSGGSYGMGSQTGFNVNQASGINTTQSFGFNYIDKLSSHVSVAASYFINAGTNDKSSEIHRTYINNFNPEVSQIYNENSNNTNKSLNHRVNLRLTWMIDTSNTLLYTPRLSFQNSNLSQVFVAGYNTKYDTLNKSMTDFSNKGSGMNLNNTLLYMHKFKKSGRTISVNAANEINTKTSTSYNDNRNYTFVNLPYVIHDSAYFLNQNISNDAPSEKWNTKLTYTEPLSAKSTVSIEYAYNYTKNESNKTTYNYDSLTGKYSKLDNSLSNVFNSRFTTQQMGAMYSYRGTKLTFSTGGNYQIYNLTGSQLKPIADEVKFQMNNFLPRIMLNYKFSKSANLRAFGRMSTNAPNINQLQNVIDNSNPLLLTTGNSNLDQEISRFGVIRFSKVNVEKGKNFFAGMMGNSTGNYITNNTTFFNKDTQISEGFTAQRGSQLSKPVNIQGYYTARIFGNYGFPLKRIKSNLNLNGSYSYSHTPGFINGQKNIAGTETYNAGAVISSNINENLDFTISYTGNYYNTLNSLQTKLNNQYFNHMANVKFNYILFKKFVFNTEWTYNNYSGLSNGFNQTFMLWNSAIAYKFLKKNAGELRFSCFDMLKQNNSIARTITETYVEDNITKVLQQYFMLTFTYNLRKLNGNMPAQNPPMGMPPNSTGSPHGH